MKDSGSKYRRAIQHEDGHVDVYAVLEAFGVTCPARQHAIKKLLCAGLRGKADELQDLTEARDAVDRAVELQQGRKPVAPAATLPDLQPVIDWLEAGCDPKNAAKELRIYQSKMRRDTE